MQNYVFGYGSLTNPKSLQKTLPGKKPEGWAYLNGFQPKFNTPAPGYLFLNIIPKIDRVIKGMLIPVSEEEFMNLKKREVGYEAVDVTKNIKPASGGRVFTFIAPDETYPQMKILKSYINVCLEPLPPEEHEKWLQETVIENEIEDDSASPKYKNI